MIRLSEGDAAPAFALPDQDGAVWRLAEFAGQTSVLFFYPRADTPGCTTEARDFSDRMADFAAAGATVAGISADSPNRLAKFRERNALRVTLLSDQHHGTLRAYGVWGEKSMYGRTFEGILRTTFLIGPDGRIVALWRNVRVPGHAAAVLADVRSRLGKPGFSEN